MLIFGGIDTYMWTWSAHTAPYISSIPSIWHKCLMISTRSLRTLPYITFRLYFGINTIWYLQLNFVCDKLLSSIFGYLPVYEVGCQTFSIIPRRFFIAIGFDTSYSVRSAYWRGLNGLTVMIPHFAGFCWFSHLLDVFFAPFYVTAPFYHGTNNEDKNACIPRGTQAFVVLTGV